MSEVKVNKISPRSGTTVTLGDSGDTFTLGSGANIAGLTLSDNILFDTASKGIYLGVTSATASNLLDDYEEGTFTPSAQFAATNPTAGFTTGVGSYTKVGNMVTVWGNVTDINVTGASGDLRIQGLPFTSTADASLDSYGGTALVAFIDYNDSSYVTAYIPDGLSYVQLAESQDNFSRDFINVANCNDGQSDIFFNVTYKTSS